MMKLICISNGYLKHIIIDQELLQIASFDDCIISSSPGYGFNEIFRRIYYRCIIDFIWNRNIKNRKKLADQCDGFRRISISFISKQMLLTYDAVVCLVYTDIQQMVMHYLIIVYIYIDQKQKEVC